MQALSKLEKRFKSALANLDKGADGTAQVKENTQLSKRIKKLEDVQVNKDEKITMLREKVTGLTEKHVEAVKQTADLQKSGLATQKEITDLQSSLAKVEMAKDTALTQVGDLQGKLKEIGGKTVNTAKTTDGGVEVADLKAKLEAANITLQDHVKRMRGLRGSLRQIRAGLKGNILNAQDVNTAMQAELEALHAQREVDLTEVNVILEKLTPLVEGK